MTRNKKMFIGVLVLCMCLITVSFREFTGHQFFLYNEHAESISVTLPQSSLSQSSSTISSELITRILLLSYQRTGSTFIGGIFKDPERIFYTYEPLDPVYAAMYGVEDGWSVPSDIFNYKNGTLRSIPQEEFRAIRWTTEKIFECEMSSLPPAILAHKFWSIFKDNMIHTQGYSRCLYEHNLNADMVLQKCHRFIRDVCGVRFGTNPARQENCRKVLWGDDLATDLEYYIPNGNKYRYSLLNESLPSPFRKYFQCLIRVEPILTKCAKKYLDEPCRDRTLRVIKTVRANMQFGELLLKSNEHSYLIHLYRDPRGAVRSRLKAPWARGLSNNSSAVHEAQLYCSQVLSDIRRRIKLEQQGYANRIKVIVYDDFVREPLLNVLDIYHFIGQEPSTEVKDTYNNTRSRTVGNELMPGTKWARDLTPDDVKAINTACSEFLKETGFK